MAKNKPKAPNTRAARRAASPSLDVDKSLTSLPRAESSNAQRPSILADRANAGIQKKQSLKRQSRAQRLRQQKGMDRAEAVLDRLEIKKNKSLDRARNIKSRRGDWEDMNKKTSKFAALEQDDESDDNDGDEAMTESTTQPQTPANPFASSSNVASNPVANDPAPVDEDDEIT
ncbi:hypothetical protein N7492_010469 [Penicillium capsulatum]|uniref:Ribosome biogenesis protein Alb1 n=1 Tax=Penicillium capsulatum TaxID=69766 RepID=A0A9W9HRF6_9EURO|nr:hypothetical protein N7492_010469 [Penicillium capsulatum]KAJ6112972.1 hypothetical protein N7512_008296 [Penicillium capsulatum]